MSNNTSSSLLIRLVWQGAIVVGLIAGAWVISQILPLKGKIAVPQQVAQVSTAPAVTSSTSIRSFQLPQVGNAGPSALEAINAKVASAKQEIIIAARQIAATSLLNNIKERKAAGVSIVTLLSADTANDFPNSRLALWLKKNSVTGIYRDILISASHVIVVDNSTVIVSDLPFSQKAYEADDATVRNAALGFVYIIEDETLAKNVAGALKSRALAENKIL